MIDRDASKPGSEVEALEKKLNTLAVDVGVALQALGLKLATAESCTGGWIGQVVTSVAGSSAWFERGYVTYSNESKSELLGVPEETITRFGAVSEQTARAMAEGVLLGSRADVAVAVTGVAGPGGGTADKPVGLVWIAWAGKQRNTLVRQCKFDGSRMFVRAQSVIGALHGLLEYLHGGEA